MKSNLSIFLWLLMVLMSAKKPLPNPSYTDFPLCFFSKSFIVLALRFRSLSSWSSVLYMVWGRDPNLFFRMRRFSCPGTTSWRDILSALSSLGTCWKPVDQIHFWALSSSPLVYESTPVPRSLHYCSFVVSFEMEKCSPPTLFFFKAVLAILCPW